MQTATPMRPAHLHVLGDELLLHLLLDIQELQLLPRQPFPRSLQIAAQQFHLSTCITPCISVVDVTVACVPRLTDNKQA